MTRLALLVGIVAIAGCSAAPPLVQVWLAVLVDRGGFSIVYRTRVTELYPSLTYTDCPSGPYVLAAQRRCSGLDARRRVFDLVGVDRGHRVAFYQEAP